MSLDANSMEPNDLYEDKVGQVWRVTGLWREPVVCMERVLNQDKSPAVDADRKIMGGVSGCMWAGFNRLSAKPTTTTGG